MKHSSHHEHWAKNCEEIQNLVSNSCCELCQQEWFCYFREVRANINTDVTVFSFRISELADSIINNGRKLKLPILL